MGNGKWELHSHLHSNTPIKIVPAISCTSMGATWISWYSLQRETRNRIAVRWKIYIFILCTLYLKWFLRRWKWRRVQWENWSSDPTIMLMLVSKERSNVLIALIYYLLWMQWIEGDLCACFDFFYMCTHTDTNALFGRRLFACYSTNSVCI